MPRSIGLFTIACWIAVGFATAQDSRPMPVKSNVHGFEMKRIDGTQEKLSTYKGKVILIVNTASECGYTPQYAGLQKLHETFGTRGFEVLGFPCNDFGNQEPGDEPDILAFCQSEFKVAFPMFSKVKVKGDAACDLYKYLQKDSAAPSPVKWNFHKFLVDGDGTVLAAFGSKTTPEDAVLTKAIEDALKGAEKKAAESKPAAKPATSDKPGKTTETPPAKGGV